LLKNSTLTLIVLQQPHGNGRCAFLINLPPNLVLNQLPKN